MHKKGIKITIADDNENIRNTLKDILADIGYTVETVVNGYELIAHIKEAFPHVVILDLMMPEKDGVTIFSTIKSISPDTKIIIYTGYQKYENSVIAANADKFLLKNEDPGELMKAVKELAGAN